MWWASNNQQYHSLVAAAFASYLVVLGCLLGYENGPSPSWKQKPNATREKTVEV
jgi:hypothetical protein